MPFIAASFPIPSTIYLPETITGKKYLNSCQFWRREAQQGQIITIMSEDLPCDILLLKDHPLGNTRPHGIFLGRTEEQPTIIYVLVNLEFSMRTAFQTLILSFVASSFLPTAPHFYGVSLVIALFILPSPLKTYPPILREL